MEERAITVAVCDDHRMFAEALAYALTRRGCSVPSVTAAPDEAIVALARLDVDVLLLDHAFPDGGTGLEAIPRLRAAHPDLKVLMLTGYRDAHLLARALSAGAAGILHKSQDVDAICRALHHVLDGHVVVDYPTPALPEEETDQGRDVRRLARFLTPREREVLGRLVEGQSTVVIARSMGVAVSTARAHLQSVLTKLGAHSRLEAASLAVTHDLLGERSVGSQDLR